MLLLLRKALVEKSTKSNFVSVFWIGYKRGDAFDRHGLTRKRATNYLASLNTIGISKGTTPKHNGLGNAKSQSFLPNQSREWCGRWDRGVSAKNGGGRLPKVGCNCCHGHGMIGLERCMMCRSMLAIKSDEKRAVYSIRSRFHHICSIQYVLR